MVNLIKNTGPIQLSAIDEGSMNTDEKSMEARIV